jgi:integrase
MSGAEGRERDLASLRVVQCGALEATGDPFEPYRLVDAEKRVVAPVAAYLRDLQACGRGAATLRSYGMDLLRWFRFLWTVEILWEQATRVEARDFCGWMRITDKPVRPHWRHRDSDGLPRGSPSSGVSSQGPNAVTGKPAGGRGYAPATVVHCETVLRSFYDFHLQVGSGPMVNPFPLARERAGGRAHAHHNPMEPFGQMPAGRYRPRVARRIPRQIPDERFDELFAGLGCHRDRALVALWVSTGARASELLGVRVCDADPGQQLITVIRKGSRVVQQLPASPDAFVWLRLYQAQMQDLVRTGPDDPLWWTRRRPFRPLSYHAARAMFGRVNAVLGANWTIHDLRHSAAYRMARDPKMALTDVQWVLGHAHLSTTQRYLVAPTEDVIAAVLAHHARHADGQPTTSSTDTDHLPYRPESLRVLFGQDPQ